MPTTAYESDLELDWLAFVAESCREDFCRLPASPNTTITMALAEAHHAGRSIDQGWDLATYRSRVRMEIAEKAYQANLALQRAEGRR